MDRRYKEAKELPPEEKFKIAGTIKRSKTATEIIAVLSNGPATVTKIVQKTRIDQPTISQSLAKMRNVGYVTCRNAGKFVVYSLTGITFKDILKEYAQMIEV